jgi:CheY-like chemotaxis protein
MLSKDAKILVVDDMKMIRKSIIKYLRELGYEDIIEAANGAEAIAKVRVGAVNFIFLDIVMPNLTGDEALKKIRELEPNLPIAMLTSVYDEDVINSCKEQGIVGYILKPLDAKTGPERISKALARVA